MLRLEKTHEGYSDPPQYPSDEEIKRIKEKYSKKTALGRRRTDFSEPPTEIEVPVEAELEALSEDTTEPEVKPEPEPESKDNK